MNIRINLLFAALLLSSQISFSQHGNRASFVDVASQVVDESGAPIPYAMIVAGEGDVTTYADIEGRFSIKAKDKSIVLVEAEGYKDYFLDLKVGLIPKHIRMTSERFLAGEKDKLMLADGGVTDRLALSSAIELVDVEHLSKYPDLNLSNALQGQAAGLWAPAGNGGLGINTSSMFVRGLHAAGTAAIVVVDGIERDLNDINPAEIGSIEILKDAAAKVLYGPRAANGVVFVTTKHGEVGKRIIRSSLEYGVTQSTRVPTFLGSAEYATLFNEARENDGLPDYYSQSQIAGYAVSKGINDTLFPDVDWYDNFTTSNTTYRKATLEFGGGNKNIRYAMVASYTGGDGLEKVGDASRLDRFNVRGNLDISINDYLTAVIGMGARLENRSWSKVIASTMFSKISTLRPNEYPYTVDSDLLQREPDENSLPFYGGSVRSASNLWADMESSGYSVERYVTSQNDFGFKFDFNEYVKGLSFDTYVTFDNYSMIKHALSRQYPTYEVTTFNSDSGVAYRLNQLLKLNENDNIQISSVSTTRTIGWRVSGNYAMIAGIHRLSANVGFRFYKDEVLGTDQNCVTSNTSLRLDYSYNDRLFAEFTTALMGSNQLDRNHRFFLSPALSMAWIASKEPFVKFKASAGILGYDSNSNYLLWRTSWSYPGNLVLGPTGNVTQYKTELNVYGSDNLGWTTSSECNLGTEFYFLDNRLSGEANVFYELRDNIINPDTNSYSSVAGSFVPYANCGKVANRGIDVLVKWSDRFGGNDFRYSAGLNLLLSKNKILAANEIPGIEDYRTSIGRSTSSIYGLVSEGVFGKEVDITTHVPQYFGDYKEGDLAYSDLNGDDIVDGRDMKFLGQTFPVATMGLNLEVSYKNFGFYVLGTASLGASLIQNNSYYWNTGYNSYSTLALKRYHPVNNPDGTLPRLTTTNGSNSYQTSSFWVKKADFFRLKNVEFSYKFKSCRIFLRGTNLFVISPIKDLDPERIDAGVTNYPVYRMISAGLTLSL